VSNEEVEQRFNAAVAALGELFAGKQLIREVSHQTVGYERYRLTFSGHRFSEVNAAMYDLGVAIRRADAPETDDPRMPLEHYRAENGKLRKALADLMKHCPRCRAEAKEAMSEMIRKGNALQGGDELAAVRDAANIALTCEGTCRYDEAGLFYRDPKCSTHGTPSEKAAGEQS
jgi:hypothetical protein